MKSPQQPEVIFDEADSFTQAYANSVQIRMTMWDMELVFGKIKRNTGDSGAAAVVIENFGAITVSPSQAKALSEVLAQHVKMYEENFGPIPLKQWTPKSTVAM
jgi:Protein of unknown function (DUF3467)